MTDANRDETTIGHVRCHCSEDDGVPDFGVSIGLGSGRSLWLGELLTRDGGDLGVIVHGPDGQRDVAVLWPTCEWQDAADLLRHYVGPAIAQAHAAGRAEGLEEAEKIVRRCELPMPFAPGLADGAAIASRLMLAAIRARITTPTGGKA